MAYEVIQKRANEIDAPFYCVDHSLTRIKQFSLDGTILDYDSYSDVFIPLLGEYQPFNATNALCAIDILRKGGVSISDDAIRRGLSSVVWHARFEILSKEPLIIADGAHNPEGVLSAVQSVKKYFSNERLNVISGVMADKDYRYIAEQIGEIANRVYCITPDNPRALGAREDADVFADISVQAQPFETVSDALNYAIEDSKREGRPLICLGSLYMYSQVCDFIDAKNI